MSLKTFTSSRPPSRPQSSSSRKQAASKQSISNNADLYQKLNIDPMGQLLLEKLIGEKVSLAMKSSIKIVLDRFDANYQ